MIAELVFSTGSLTVLFLLFIIMLCATIFISDGEGSLFSTIFVSIIFSSALWAIGLLFYMFLRVLL